MKRFVYADNSATTPVAADVLEAMIPYYKEGYGNPSTLYSKGREAKTAIETARAQVAALINAQPGEIIFTGSGSEADNMALKGVMTGRAAKGRKRFITTAIEHHAILNTAESLKKAGFEAVILPVDEFGRVSAQQVADAIDGNTALVSVMAANNEIGTLEPVSEIAEVCRRAGVLFHTDAVQAAGHVPVDVKAIDADLMSMSAHKINGPKGVGALYIKKGVAVSALIDGGGQERKLRSGTENVAGIVGFGKAAEIAMQNMETEIPRICAMRDRLIEGVLSSIPYCRLTGDPVNRRPGTASFTFECIEGEALILRLDAEGICASTGSACSTGSLDPSHVLMAIGLPHEIAHGSLRLSLGMYNTMEDVDYIIEKLKDVVSGLRAMSPLWDERAGKPAEFY